MSFGEPAFSPHSHLLSVQDVMGSPHCVGESVGLHGSSSHGLVHALQQQCLLSTPVTPRATRGEMGDGGRRAGQANIQVSVTESPTEGSQACPRLQIKMRHMRTQLCVEAPLFLPSTPGPSPPLGLSRTITTASSLGPSDLLHSAVPTGSRPCPMSPLHAPETPLSALCTPSPLASAFPVPTPAGNLPLPQLPLADAFCLSNPPRRKPPDDRQYSRPCAHPPDTHHQFHVCPLLAHCPLL